MARNTKAIIQSVRGLMAKHKLNAYIVPSEDAHFSEYVAECDKRREFVCGFTGSAGTALILENASLLWTDGRYFLQAEQQLDENWELMRAFTENVPTLSEYLSDKKPGAVGFAADSMSFSRFKEMKSSLESAGVTLVGLDRNLIDEIWQDRPQRPEALKMTFMTESNCGHSIEQKLQSVRAEMKKVDADLLVLTSLDDCAWLFNYRATGVIPQSPVMFAYCLLTQSEAHLFCHLNSSVEPEFRSHLGNAEVQLHSYTHFFDNLKCMVAASKARVWLDIHANAAVGLQVPESRIYLANSPVAVMKAVKTAAEMAGMERAHVLDAVALCRYLHWLECEISAGHTVTELSGSDYLDSLRAEMEEFVEVSFPSISGAGPNGAIVHYRVDEQTDRQIGSSEIYLIDSGGHYTCGTTDVTRTVHTGVPTDEERMHFTRVLMGHIDLSMATFPSGVIGSRLDCIARQALWQIGQDYAHGTGHGVGHFLNVHEGPCAISGAKYRPNEIGLLAGMVVTIEPGFYPTAKYGIRIENVVAVEQHKLHNKFLTFRPLTLAPISRKLIDKSLLTTAQVNWINNYHNCVSTVVGKELLSRGFSNVYDWLMVNTAAI